MRFVTSQNDLNYLIRKIQNVIPQNPSFPILSHLLIEADNDNMLSFTATDLTIGMRSLNKAKVFEKGSISLPAKHFFQLVKELHETHIECILDNEKNTMHIKTESSHFQLKGTDQQKFPSLPDLRDSVQCKIPGAQLKEMLYRTCFAASKEDNRQILSGICMSFSSGKLIFLGADGKRLAKTEHTVNIAPEFSETYVLPLKAAEEMTKILTEEEATLYLRDDKVALSSENDFLITNLLSGKYPDFQQVISSPRDISMSLHREELISLLKQISLFLNQNANSTCFTFIPGELILTANHPDIGEGKVSMPVNYTGEKLEIAFNPHIFIDVLRRSKDEVVSLGISDSYNPGIITDSTESLFVLMPMRSVKAEAPSYSLSSSSQ